MYGGTSGTVYILQSARAETVRLDPAEFRSSCARAHVTVVRRPRECQSQDVGWWKVAAGAVIVVFTVREMFNDLFHPTQSGAMSEWIGSGLFRLLKRWPSMLPSSGPLTIAAVIFTWALLLAVGFALIYWEWFPGAYDFQTATRPGPKDGFAW